jgi:alpha-glucosidase
MLGRQGPTQIGLEISQGIRRAVKEAKPDAYLMGENFFDSTGQLQGDQWDGVMNYGGFTHPLWYWLSGYTQGAHGFTEMLTGPQWPTEAMAGMWQTRLAAIPWAIALQQYNILDSHDTVRIRTLLKDNDTLHRLAAAVLFTFPGVPGLYYGDEIGMLDVPGLGARGCMVWDEARQDRALREYHRELIRLRRSSTALQRGGFQMLAVEPDMVAYQRESRDERVIVIAHRAAADRPAGPLSLARGGVADGTRFRDVFGGDEYLVQDGALSLPSLSQGAVILQEVP